MSVMQRFGFCNKLGILAVQMCGRDHKDVIYTSATFTAYEGNVLFTSIKC